MDAMHFSGPAPAGSLIGQDPWQTSLRITRAHQAWTGKSRIRQEIAVLREQFPAILQPIAPADLLAGRIAYAPIGHSPEPGGFGYFCHAQHLTPVIADATLPANLRQHLTDALAYWAQETTAHEVRAAYPADLARALPSDAWTDEPGVAFPLYRMAGAYLDYDKLIRLGLSGLKAEARQRMTSAFGEELEFCQGLIDALDLVAHCARCYEVHARDLARNNPADAPRLTTIAQACHAIADRVPQTLREGMQLAWLYSLVASVLNYGRMDVYLGDLLAADLETGRLTLAQAQDLVNAQWRLIAARASVYNGRIVIGGKGRRNEANADRFALLAIEASRVVEEIEPQLTLRFHHEQNTNLWEAAMRNIGQGRVYPMLYNDDVNVPAVASAFAIDRSTAEQYVPFGCGEYVIDHQSFGTPNGVINLLKALEVTLFNGQELHAGRTMGLQLGSLETYQSFDELLEAYKKQVEHYTAALAEQEVLEYQITGQQMPFLLYSALYDDCIARAKPIFAGGIRYLGGTIETYGNTNTADALTAIKTLVYDRKALSPRQLLNALRDNFQGHEAIRGLLLQAPKYGNDDPVADAMAALVHDHICHTAMKQAQRVGLHSYLVVIINNSANTIMGRLTGASADGRLKAEPMANANNPQGGADKTGLTAMLSSLVKLSPNIHAGAVQNLKLSKGMFQQHREKIDAALAAYFDMGGTQAMITVLNRGDLEEAMVHPERHANLMVRVGGFCARFVELERKVQEEILARTLY